MNIRPSIMVKIGSLTLVAGAVWMGAATAAFAQDTGGDVNRGARAWADHCSRCHNARNATEFRDDLWEPVVNHMRIRAGLPGATARDIRAFLLASNFSVATTAAVADSGLSGQEIYAGTCVTCHGADGKGALPGVPNLSDRLSQKPDDLLLKNIIEGYQSPGSTMAMPARGGSPNLSDADLRRVLSYLREKFGK